jgi:hypothetical protein
VTGAAHVGEQLHDGLTGESGLGHFFQRFILAFVRGFGIR